MPGILHGTISYPGIVSVEAFQATLSHGITPSTLLVKMHPQPGLPDAQGDLVLTDGNETVVFPSCKVDNIKVEMDDRGVYWSVALLDRRWKWGDLGILNGCFNQLDVFGKLIPWTIRSPTELAIIALNAMGEVGYTLNLPPGLNYPGPAVQSGITNISGVNPPVNWDGVPPAQALASLAEQFGCRVIYRLSTNSVYVGPIGAGALLPPGSVSRQGPSLKAPQTPDSIGVIGSPTRYQVRLRLIAVGEEWDGSYRPIDLLSYAPQPPKGGKQGLPQINQITPVNPQNNVTYKVTINDTTIGVKVTNNVVADACTAIKNGINNQSAVDKPPAKDFGLVTADSDGTKVTVTGKKNGVAYDLSVDVSPPQMTPPQSISQVLTQAAVPDPQVKPIDILAGQTVWANSPPPFFPGIRATDRLSIDDARRLAQKSVFKTYQIVNRDVAGFGPIYVPGFGLLLRKEQIILQDTQVDQVVPAPGDPNIIDPFTGVPVTVNFYNGYSRDKPAAVYGSVYNDAKHGIWYTNAKNSQNTPSGSQVFIPFTVDPLRFLIRFSDYALRYDGGVLGVPTLTLQTAVLVRHPVGNQIQSYTKIIPLPGQNSQTNPKMRHYPDIQANVTSSYDANNKLLAWGLLEADAVLRADYYLAAMANEYQLIGGQTIDYNGIRAIDVDGAIAQVSWYIDEGGCHTTASRNCEHSIWVPPYPARRRLEFLPAVARVFNAATATAEMWEAPKK
jgi:hypothetical protein